MNLRAVFRRCRRRFATARSTRRPSAATSRDGCGRARRCRRARHQRRGGAARRRRGRPRARGGARAVPAGRDADRRHGPRVDARDDCRGAARGRAAARTPCSCERRRSIARTRRSPCWSVTTARSPTPARFRCSSTTFRRSTGVNLTPETVARLAAHPNIVGMKETGTDARAVRGAGGRRAASASSVLAGGARLSMRRSAPAPWAPSSRSPACVPELCLRLRRARCAPAATTEALALQQRLTPLARAVTTGFGVPG